MLRCYVFTEESRSGVSLSVGIYLGMAAGRFQGGCCRILGASSRRNKILKSGNNYGLAMRYIRDLSLKGELLFTFVLL